jgi:hypothetical protein
LELERQNLWLFLNPRWPLASRPLPPKSARCIASIAPPTLAGEFAIDLLRHSGPERGASEVWFKMLMLWHHRSSNTHLEWGPNLSNKLFPNFFCFQFDKIDETMPHFVIVVVSVCCKDQKAIRKIWHGLK